MRRVKRNICFGYLLELPLGGDSNKYLKPIFCEKIRIKQGFTYMLLFIKDSLQEQIYFNCNVVGNECCCYNEGSLYKAVCIKEVCIAPGRALFYSQKVRILSYFCTKMCYGYLLEAP